MTTATRHGTAASGPPSTAAADAAQPHAPAGTWTCCSPLAREPLTADDATHLAGVLKAVADPTRLRLLSLIYAQEGAEACVCELTEPLGLTQPTISHHLKVLVDVGILTRDKRGVWAYYKAVPETLTALSNMINPGC